MNTIISQALATGLPVIATDHSGLPEQIIDGKNGLVIPEADVSALANSINFLIQRDDLWPAMGRFGRAHVEKNYDAKKLIDRQINFYCELIGSANNLIGADNDSVVASQPK